MSATKKVTKGALAALLLDAGVKLAVVTAGVVAAAKAIKALTGAHRDSRTTK